MWRHYQDNRPSLQKCHSGLLFGCSAAHHHLGKFLTRIGIQKRESAMPPMNPEPDLVSTALPPIEGSPVAQGGGPVLVRIDEDAKSRIGYWLMVATSVATV